MNNWAVFGHIVRLHGKGHIYRSGTIIVWVVGDTEEDAIKQAELQIEHFHHDEVYPKDDVQVTILEAEAK